jgi:hypothetical protein
MKDLYIIICCILIFNSFVYSETLNEKEIFSKDTKHYTIGEFVGDDGSKIDVNMEVTLAYNETDVWISEVRSMIGQIEIFERDEETKESYLSIRYYFISPEVKLRRIRKHDTFIAFDILLLLRMEKHKYLKEVDNTVEPRLQMLMKDIYGKLFLDQKLELNQGHKK